MSPGFAWRLCVRLALLLFLANRTIAISTAERAQPILVLVDLLNIFIVPISQTAPTVLVSVNAAHSHLIRTD